MDKFEDGSNEDGSGSDNPRANKVGEETSPATTKVSGKKGRVERW